MLINNINVDLEKIGITFTPNEEQAEALSTLASFLELDNGLKTATLAGSAGTGKTACTKILLEYIRNASHLNYDVELSTPTHKAKAVLKRLSGGGESISTIHKQLGLRPNLDIREFDARNVDFLLEDFLLEISSRNTLYIVDEGGMIPDDLLDFMVETLITKRTNTINKIIFIGDHKQLKPVGQTKIAKVFRGTDVKAELNKVERVVNGSVILEPITLLRDSHFEEFYEVENDFSGVKLYPDGKSFMREVKKKYELAIEEGNPDAIKVMCFTNRRVEQFNQAIMKALDFDDPLEVKGFFMGNSMFTAPHSTAKGSIIYKKFLQPRGVTDSSKGYFRNPQVFNGTDYVLKYKEATSIEIPRFRTLSGYYIEMLDTTDNKLVSLYMIDPNESETNYSDLAHAVESLRLKAIDKSIPYNIRKSYWKYYHAINEKFVSLYDLVYEGRVVRKADFVPGYAITVHKSQGSSINEVFIDSENFKKCFDKEGLRELQYVSCSRARSYIHVLQKS